MCHLGGTLIQPFPRGAVAGDEAPPRSAQYFVRVMLLLAFGLPALFAGLTTILTEPPAWLELRPGQTARAAEAPWPLGTKPEAGLTASEASAAAVDPDALGKRPADALGVPVGVRVTIQRLYSDRVALVQDGAGHAAYVRVELLVPEIPAATLLVVAGEDGDDVDFYQELGTRSKDSLDVSSGVALTALGLGVAPFEPSGSEFIRVHVKVESGELRGRTGWLAAKYVGLPGRPDPDAPAKDRACACRVVEFR